MTSKDSFFAIYRSIPLFGEVCFEWDGGSKGRRFFDALINVGGFELWAGRAHLIVDPHPRFLHRVAAMTAAIVMLAGLAYACNEMRMRDDPEPATINDPQVSQTHKWDKQKQNRPHSC